MRKHRRTIEMVGSILVLLSVLFQFFILSELSEIRNQSFILAIQENQAKAFYNIREIVSASIMQRPIDSGLIDQNRPMLYSEVDNSLTFLTGQISLFNYIFAAMFALGSAMAIWAKYVES